MLMLQCERCISCAADVKGRERHEHAVLSSELMSDSILTGASAFRATVLAAVEDSQQTGTGLAVHASHAVFSRLRLQRCVFGRRQQPQEHHSLLQPSAWHKLPSGFLVPSTSASQSAGEEADPCHATIWLEVGVTTQVCTEVDWKPLGTAVHRQDEATRGPCGTLCPALGWQIGRLADTAHGWKPQAGHGQELHWVCCLLASLVHAVADVDKGRQIGPCSVSGASCLHCT